MVENGICAYDLIESPKVCSETFVKAKVFLEQNYGKEYPQEKFAMLFELIREEGWTEAKFKEVFKWFRKNKYNHAWTESDWFQWSVKLYPWRHYREHCFKLGIREVDFQKSLQCYSVDGVLLYREDDGTELPLRRVF